MAASWEEVVRIGLELPEVEESTWFNTPSLKVRKKSFCRLRVRLSTVDPEMLREQIIEAWLRKAPKRLAKAWIDERPA